MRSLTFAPSWFEWLQAGQWRHLCLQLLFTFTQYPPFTQGPVTGGATPCSALLLTHQRDDLLIRGEILHL